MFNIKPIRTANTLLDHAFKRARKKSKTVKKHKDELTHKKALERAKLDAFVNYLTSALKKTLKDFPSVDSFNEFYQKLLRIHLDYVQLKKALGSLNWASKKINELYRKYNRKISHAQDVSQFSKLKREYFGRLSSVLKQIKEEISYLEEARKIFNNFPKIKDLFTVAIAGFPNVGKSTLLSKLSTSKPEIAEYAFTTKHINIGYMKKNTTEVQLLDTPGTLNRFDKMNPIEQEAALAIDYLADLIVYVFDLSETYSLKKQKKLYKKLKHKKRTLIYLSKIDVVDKERVDKFKKEFDCFVDVDRLKEEIVEESRKS